MNKAKKHKNQILKNQRIKLPNIDAILGIQFENFVLNNRILLKSLLHIEDQVVYDNPYFQRPTQQKKGCQIDYLIQTRFNNLYVCEIKFSKQIIEKSVIHELMQKINALTLPREFSDGVSDEVYDANYFSEIIDFGQLLNFQVI